MSVLDPCDFASAAGIRSHELATAALMASGGDERITLDPASGLNRYHSAPYPRAMAAYASSTANDISPAAFAHVTDLAASRCGTYAERLDDLRRRIRAAYRLAPDCEIVFAPSGTDLEYVALAAVAARAPIHNVLLGADEVGSGCRLSAHGKFFAATTARGVAVTPGECVPGLEQVSLVDIPVRCAKGLPRGRAAVADIGAEIEKARGMGRHALIHVVHGSKTGLILPELAEIDSILAEGRADVSLVIDACQARITTGAVHAYLERGAIVFLTGSKFIGGPPFSGIALVPRRTVERAGRLPQGLADVFRRAEWPGAWPGRELLAEEDNPGLWLRLEAAIFELERFQALKIPEIERILDAFDLALTSRLVEPLGLARVDPHPPGDRRAAREHPIEMRTLATLDTHRLPGARTFEDAQRLHRSLALSGVRLGQPVRSVRTSSGEWGGTLRIGLSMPQMVEWSRLDDAALNDRLSTEMADIADALAAERRAKAA